MVAKLSMAERKFRDGNGVAVKVRRDGGAEYLPVVLVSCLMNPSRIAYARISWIPRRRRAKVHRNGRICLAVRNREFVAAQTDPYPRATSIERLIPPLSRRYLPVMPATEGGAAAGRRRLG